MKKNISINISGIIFHIEEDAFDELKHYLDGINRYFSSFTDSQEIIDDIENRIAEIFLTKLHDEKQVITTDDVVSLQAVMGSISDFQAAEEELGANFENTDNGEDKGQTFYNYDTKKLYRDVQRSLVGGVCAGIAHYFRIDPLWVRLLFIILTIGSGGIILPVYVVMWAVVPKSSDLPEDKEQRKMFRDPDSKIVAGVCAGVAGYFGIDVVIVRVFFFISLFLGGFGFITYLCLWVILPEAKSVSEKVQMKGDPITLSNIETNIKQRLRVKEDEEESTIIKLILLPFRLAATLIEALGKIIGPFIRLFTDIIRVALGVILVLIGTLSILGVVIALGILIGIFSSEAVDTSVFRSGQLSIPFDTMVNGLPAWTIAAAVLVVIIPMFFFILSGASIIARRMLFGANTGWTLLAGFVISIIVLAVNIPMIAIDFSEEGDYTVKTDYDLGDRVAVLKLRDSGYRGYTTATLKLRGHGGSTYRLDQVFEARGSSVDDAENNAKMVSYKVARQDSMLYFDANLTFDKEAKFRAQQLDMTLYIPYGAKFMMDKELRHILRNTIYKNGYRVSDIEDNLWIYTMRGLECLTCPEVRYRKNYDDEFHGADRYDHKTDRTPAGYDREMAFEPFNKIEIEGAFIVEIVPGSEHKLRIRGRERYMSALKIEQSGDRLFIGVSGFREEIQRWALSEDDIELTIEVPDLEKLEITGACSAYINDFNLNSLTIDLMGASSLKADMRVDDLNIELTGASNMELRGLGQEMRADVMGASRLDADAFRVKYAWLEAEGASKIKAFVTEEITMEESFVSNIKYRGSARLRDR